MVLLLTFAIKSLATNSSLPSLLEFVCLYDDIAEEKEQSSTGAIKYLGRQVDENQLISPGNYSAYVDNVEQLQH